MGFALRILFFCNRDVETAVGGVIFLGCSLDAFSGAAVAPFLRTVSSPQHILSLLFVGCGVAGLQQYFAINEACVLLM